MRLLKFTTIAILAYSMSNPAIAVDDGKETFTIRQNLIENGSSLFKNGGVEFSTSSPVTFNGSALVKSTLKIPALAGAGKILTSDVSGNATWQAAPNGADNLGNHTATTNLNLNSYNITNAGSITATNITGTTFTATTFTGNLRTTTGAGVGKVLTSDATGNASWQAIPSSADNLGNHTATIDLNMSNKNITNAATITATGLRISSSPAVGKVLTSDASGNATWQTAPSGADNLGNHTATIDLNMSNKNITNVGTLTATTVSAPTVSASTISSPSLKITLNPAAGKVLTSDATGNATWQTAASGADNLGDHKATTILNMNSNNIINAGVITGNSVISNALKITVNPAAGKVLTSDADGNATWQSTTGIWADDINPSIKKVYPRDDQTGIMVGANSTFQADAYIDAQGGAGFNRKRLTGTSSDVYILESGSSSNKYLLMADSTNNKVGIGTNNNPTEKLEVGGKIKATGLVLTTGAANNLVLTSDASGNATWRAPTVPVGGGADNLGDHTATKPLHMSNFDITNVGDISALSFHGGLFDGNHKGTFEGDGSKLTGLKSPAFKIIGNSIVNNGSLANYNNNFVIGSPNTDDTGSTINDTRLVFNKAKAALRAGSVDATQWDNSNTGTNSVAFGKNTTASGTGALAAGDNALASAATALSFGTNTIASGINSISLGKDNSATGANSISIGQNTQATGINSIALGKFVKASGSQSMVIGFGNTSVDPLENNVIDSLAIAFKSNVPTLFVGPATGASSDGKVGIGTNTPQDLLDVDGRLRTKELRIINGAGDGKVLTSDATGNATWRDSGSGADNLGDHKATRDINMNSSYSFTNLKKLVVGITNTNNSNNQALIYGESNTLLNSSKNSAAIGEGNSVAGQNTTAIGSYNNIDTDRAMAYGHSNRINWQDVNDKPLNSIAIGSSNRIDNSSSIAIGSTNDVRATGSYAFGYKNSLTGGTGALGQMALGSNINSSSIGTVGLGEYLNSGAHWAYVIGRGVDVNNKLSNTTSNSLNIGFKSNLPTLHVGPATGIGTYGKVGIATATPTEALEVNGKIKSSGFVMSTGSGAGKVLTSDATGNASWQDASSAGAEATLPFKTYLTGTNFIAYKQGAVNNITGGGNIGLGHAVFGLNLGKILTGDQNVGIGSNTFDRLEFGSNNTGIGAGALSSIFRGEQNTALGLNALRIRSGSNNIGIGSYAGPQFDASASNYTISSNGIYLGRNTGFISTGIGNIFIGTDAAQNVRGDEIICIGNRSCSTVYSGSKNILIGNDVGYIDDTGTNSPTSLAYENYINIGNLITGFNTATNRSMKVRGHLTVENGSELKGTTWIKGQLQAQEDAYFDKKLNVKDHGTFQKNLSVSGDITAHKTLTVFQSLTALGATNKSSGSPTWTITSDSRLKDVHGSYQHGLDEILKLKTVTFSYKEDNKRGLRSDKEEIGFIAQDVKEIIPEAVSMDKDGFYQLDVNPINVAVVNAIQELKAQKDTEINELKTEIKLLKELYCKEHKAENICKK